MWNNGLLKVNNLSDVVWAWPLIFIWEFFIYISLFGFVAQFIYRYLTLNRYALNLQFEACKSGYLLRNEPSQLKI
jgi:hypothetical protein